MANIFFSYSHADEALRDELEKQLAMLKRQGHIEAWHDRRIGAGQELHSEIASHVEADDIILLLVSPDFLSSDYCYEREMERAMSRHEAGAAIVIPVILRPCDWQGAPFGRLMAAPTDGRPITQWADRDVAFLDVVKSIRAATARLRSTAQSPAVSSIEGASPRQVARARSSNLRIAKQFTERDKDRFLVDALEFLNNFFDNSVAELTSRNDGIEGDVRRIDSNRFTASLYRNGNAVARCTIFLGGHLRGIAYANGETSTSNSWNESLSVQADDHALYLKSSGMISIGSSHEQKLTMEGAAELLWANFISPLQTRGW